jgi:hypothetical protein
MIAHALPARGCARLRPTKLPNEVFVAQSRISRPTAAMGHEQPRRLAAGEEGMPPKAAPTARRRGFRDGPLSASRTAAGSCSIDRELAAGRAEVSIIATVVTRRAWRGAAAAFSNVAFVRHCHVNRKFAGEMIMAATVHPAAVVWRHVSIWSLEKLVDRTSK